MKNGMMVNGGRFMKAMRRGKGLFWAKSGRLLLRGLTAKLTK